MIGRGQSKIDFRAGGQGMADIHHFAYGWITPTLAYALSVLGSVLGLTCAVRARQAVSGGRRAGWLMMAAFALGGTGIWTMHFMAMLGFGVTGTDIRYDVPRTALSALVAIIVVGIGLFIVGGAGTGKPAAWKILLGGVVTGLGVAAMHYMGMAAMRLDGEVIYDQGLVAASMVIAVVAATVALWLSVTVRTGAAIFGSALVMGLAVCGMHFTGMAAMSVRPGEVGEITGASASTLILPIVLAVIFVVVGLAFAIMASETREGERAAATAYLQGRRADVPDPAVAADPSSLLAASLRADARRFR
jgi:NO-binding membrane sensor protein with MHYT domain